MSDIKTFFKVLNGFHKLSKEEYTELLNMIIHENNCFELLRTRNLYYIIERMFRKCDINYIDNNLDLILNSIIGNNPAAKISSLLKLLFVNESKYPKDFFKRVSPKYMEIQNLHLYNLREAIITFNSGYNNILDQEDIWETLELLTIDPFDIIYNNLIKKRIITVEHLEMSFKLYSKLKLKSNYSEYLFNSVLKKLVNCEVEEVAEKAREIHAFRLLTV